MQVLSKNKLTDEDFLKAKSAKDNSKVKETKKSSQLIKKLILKDAVQEHDLEVKCKQIAQFLYKGAHIRLMITGFKMDQKMKVLDSIKKLFSPHIKFTQIKSNESAIKLIMIPDKTFRDFFEQKYNKDETEHIDLDNEIDEASEDDLIENEDLENLINEELKK